MGNLYLNLRELEELTGFTFKTLKKKLYGIAPAKKDTHGNFYALKEILPSLYLTKDDGSLNLSEERARLAKAQAEKTEYELGRMKEELLPANDIETLWVKYIVNVRSKLLLLPKKLAKELKGITDIKTIEQKLEEHIYINLTELGQGEGVSDV